MTTSVSNVQPQTAPPAFSNFKFQEISAPSLIARIGSPVDPFIDNSDAEFEQEMYHANDDELEDAGGASSAKPSLLARMGLMGNVMPPARNVDMARDDPDDHPRSVPETSGLGNNSLLARISMKNTHLGTGSATSISFQPVVQAAIDHSTTQFSKAGDTSLSTSPAPPLGSNASSTQDQHRLVPMVDQAMEIDAPSSEEPVGPEEVRRDVSANSAVSRSINHSPVSTQSSRLAGSTHAQSMDRGPQATQFSSLAVSGYIEASMATNSSQIESPLPTTSADIPKALVPNVISSGQGLSVENEVVVIAGPVVSQPTIQSFVARPRTPLPIDQMFHDVFADATAAWEEEARQRRIQKEEMMSAQALTSQVPLSGGGASNAQVSLPSVVSGQDRSSASVVNSDINNNISSESSSDIVSGRSDNVISSSRDQHPTDSTMVDSSTDIIVDIHSAPSPELKVPECSKPPTTPNISRDTPDAYVGRQTRSESIANDHIVVPTSTNHARAFEAPPTDPEERLPYDEVKGPFQREGGQKESEVTKLNTPSILSESQRILSGHERAQDDSELKDGCHQPDELRSGVPAVQPNAQFPNLPAISVAESVPQEGLPSEGRSALSGGVMLGVLRDRKSSTLVGPPLFHDAPQQASTGVSTFHLIQAPQVSAVEREWSGSSEAALPTPAPIAQRSTNHLENQPLPGSASNHTPTTSSTSENLSGFGRSLTPSQVSQPRVHGSVALLKASKRKREESVVIKKEDPDSTLSDSQLLHSRFSRPSKIKKLDDDVHVKLEVKKEEDTEMNLSTEFNQAPETVKEEEQDTGHEQGIGHEQEQMSPQPEVEIPPPDRDALELQRERSPSEMSFRYPAEEPEATLNISAQIMPTAVTPPPPEIHIISLPSEHRPITPPLPPRNRYPFMGLDGSNGYRYSERGSTENSAGQATVRDYREAEDEVRFGNHRISNYNRPPSPPFGRDLDRGRPRDWEHYSPAKHADFDQSYHSRYWQRRSRSPEHRFSREAAFDSRARTPPRYDRSGIPPTPTRRSLSPYYYNTRRRSPYRRDVYEEHSRYEERSKHDGTSKASTGWHAPPDPCHNDSDVRREQYRLPDARSDAMNDVELRGRPIARIPPRPPRHDRDDIHRQRQDTLQLTLSSSDSQGSVNESLSPLSLSARTPPRLDGTPIVFPPKKADQQGTPSPNVLGDLSSRINTAHSLPSKPAFPTSASESVPLPMATSLISRISDPTTEQARTTELTHSQRAGRINTSPPRGFVAHRAVASAGTDQRDGDDDTGKPALLARITSGDRGEPIDLGSGIRQSDSTRDMPARRFGARQAASTPITSHRPAQHDVNQSSIDNEGRRTLSKTSPNTRSYNKNSGINFQQRRPSASPTSGYSAMGRPRVGASLRRKHVNPRTSSSYAQGLQMSSYPRNAITQKSTSLSDRISNLSNSQESLTRRMAR